MLIQRNFIYKEILSIKRCMYSKQHVFEISISDFKDNFWYSTM